MKQYTPVTFICQECGELKEDEGQGVETLFDNGAFDGMRIDTNEKEFLVVCLVCGREYTYELKGIAE